MHVLFVHEKFGAFAGAEANILAVANGLKQHRHAVAILHGQPTGKKETAWRETFKLCFPLKWANSIAEALTTFEPDIIYVHKLADVEVIKALFMSGCPLVRMVHDHDLYCLRSYKYNVFTREICQRAASPYCVFPCGAIVTRNPAGSFPLKWSSYTDKRQEIELNQKFERLVVGSQFMKNELVRNGFTSDKIEIYPPVPPPDDSPVQSDFNERNLIIYSGQIVRGKGVDVLLQSLALVREPFECFIFGDGNHRAHCEKLSRYLGLTSRVSFKGYVPPEELQSYYRGCSVAVVSSVWPEPFGAVGLEAMRYGVPVVAFDVGGIKEWLIDGYNGFLVPWMDRAVFAAQIEKLLRDKPLARLFGQNGRRMVTESYGFGKYLDNLENLFTRIACQNHRAEFTQT